MKLSELPDDFTPTMFRCLDREALDQIPYERMRWRCQWKGCEGGTHVRDYGISPWYWLDRGSKYSHVNPQYYWRQLDWHFWLCGKHHRLYMRLEPKFTYEHLFGKYIDLQRPRVLPVIIAAKAKKKKASPRGEGIIKY